MWKLSALLFIPFSILTFFYSSQQQTSSESVSIAAKEFVTGADQPNEYLPYLKGKRVGILANQTTIIGKRSLVDSLHALGVNIKMVFGPEHGFRGNASNGAHVGDETDKATGIPIISLYGGKRKPTKEEMAQLDILIFDIQDVGCRFYTNINKMRDIMEACAENGKELMILDRPNPNDFVDGPILDMKLTSGIGQFPIPITHGMTQAEFAQMINGEGWLPNKMKCKLKIVKVKNYVHGSDYTLPVYPSPNLNTQQSILLYPSLCLFEGTTVSQGRGTYMPFTVLGSPDLKGKYEFTFKPESLQGMSENPLHKDQVCYGLDLRKYDTGPLRKAGRINLQWMIDLFKAYPDKKRFFDRSQSTAIGNINFLSGQIVFKEQIMAGKTEAEIRATWERGLSQYKKMRKKYLLYK